MDVVRTLPTWILHSETFRVCVPSYVVDEQPTIGTGTEVTMYLVNEFRKIVVSSRVVAAVFFEAARPSRLTLHWTGGTYVPTTVDAVNADPRFAVAHLCPTPNGGETFTYAVSTLAEVAATEKARKEESLQRQARLQSQHAQRCVEVLHEEIIESSSNPFVPKVPFRNMWPSVLGAPRIFHVKGPAWDVMSELLPQLELACEAQTSWQYGIHVGQGYELTPLRTLFIPASPTSVARCMTLPWGPNGVNAFRKFIHLMASKGPFIFVFVIA